MTDGDQVIAECKREGCGADILWLNHAVTGKLAPISAFPSENGNVLVDMARHEYAVLAGEVLAKARTAGSELRLNHFVDCKNPPGRR